MRVLKGKLFGISQLLTAMQAQRIVATSSGAFATGGAMQSTQPATSPLGILLIVAAIYLVFKSPKRLQTLGRMVVGFIATVLVFIIPGAVLRMGDPHAQGRIGYLVALLVAVIVGWWHTRSLRGTSKETA